MDRINATMTQANDGWRAKTRKATQLIVAGLRHTGKAEALIGREVIKAAREALGDSDGSKMIMTFDVMKGDGQGAETVETLSTAGIFALVIVDGGFDRSEDRAAESFMAEIQQELGRLGL